MLTLNAGENHELVAVATVCRFLRMALLSIRLWDVRTGKEKRALKGHAFEVSHLTFSPDGKTLASSSEVDVIKLWEVEPKK